MKPLPNRSEVNLLDMKSNLDKWGHLGLNAILALVFFAYTNHLENAITRKLSGYVDTQRYDRDKMDTQRWREEYQTRTSGQFFLIDTKLDKVNDKVNEMDKKIAAMLAIINRTASSVHPDSNAVGYSTNSGR